VDLTGTGTVTLSSNGLSKIASDTTNTSFTSSNTISGAGQIGDSQMASLTNTGVIDANASVALTLSIESGQTITNNGTLESTGTGGLDIDSNVSGAGQIIASGTNSGVVIDGVSVTGATLKTSGTGAAIENQRGEGSNVVLDNVKIVAGSLVEAVDDSSLVLEDTITNAGTLEADSTGDITSIEVSGTVTLTGAGKVTLVSTGSGDGRFLSDGSTATLTNVNNTISGGGALADGLLSLTNDASGIIDGNSTVAALVLNGTTTNLGLIDGTTAEGLEITAGVTNQKTLEAVGTNANLTINSTTITNAGGLILASGTNANVLFESGTALSGGTLQTSGSGAVVDIEGTNDLTNVALAAKTVIDVNGASSNLFVNGGTAGTGAVIEIGTNNDTVDLESASGVGVSFASGGTGSTLELDAVKSSAPHAYTGTISGFGVGAGGVAHADANESILLAEVNFDSQTAVFTPNASNTGGALSIMDGTTLDATLTFSGKYTSTNFQVTDDFGIVEITDPETSSRLANVGLLNNYIAAGTGSDHGTAPLTTQQAASNQPPELATHHA
jgi:hypothetical protein